MEISAPGKICAFFKFAPAALTVENRALAKFWPFKIGFVQKNTLKKVRVLEHHNAAQIGLVEHGLGQVRASVRSAPVRDALLRMVRSIFVANQLGPDPGLQRRRTDLCSQAPERSAPVRSASPSNVVSVITSVSFSCWPRRISSSRKSTVGQVGVIQVAVRKSHNA